MSAFSQLWFLWIGASGSRGLAAIIVSPDAFLMGTGVGRPVGQFCCEQTICRRQQASSSNMVGAWLWKQSTFLSGPHYAPNQLSSEWKPTMARHSQIKIPHSVKLALPRRLNHVRLFSRATASNVDGVTETTKRRLLESFAETWMRVNGSSDIL